MSRDELLIEDDRIAVLEASGLGIEFDTEVAKDHLLDGTDGWS
ncbi:hypothetical protein [Halorubrum ejinorense]|uniref:Uncharacterized protein n=1 Tax=Halorubrum ejinorense TaxID=425309 RepID=A0AAV3SVA8_9EURY